MPVTRLPPSLRNETVALAVATDEIFVRNASMSPRSNSPSTRISIDPLSRRRTSISAALAALHETSKRVKMRMLCITLLRLLDWPTRYFLARRDEGQTDTPQSLL